MSNDRSDMYIDFGVLGNVSSRRKNTYDMNLDNVSLNDLVEVIGMELDDSILTMECACADSRISTIRTNYDNTTSRWGSK